ncbi:uncharacterized protein LOC128876145 [Hylaeus volcanicus]|uniref:uncharacterized protein LOC128876145 n=1 Tax=Hylaeus volcanicus TaxID=313075 RepID=UPI0023B826B0|nr:uncharacterized protein LOC128876145 [Hylaeus volcanicus]
MINMRALVFIFWMLVFRSILTASFVYAEDQTSDDDSSRTVEGIVIERTIAKPLLPSFGNKRNDEDKEETFPTRHAKHRKRRRCSKNRSSCSRGSLTTKLVPPGRNDTKDRDVVNAVLEVEEEPRERLILELYNETKVEDYDVSKNNEERDNVGDLSAFELTDSYGGRVLQDEIELEDTITPSWEDTSSKKQEIDKDNGYSDIYADIDDQVTFHESFGVLLTKLFQSLRNASVANGRDILKELNFVNTTNEDPCQKWLNSRDKLEKVFLGGLASLPACPCQYPSNIFYDDKIWDERQRRYFRWRDVSGDSQRLDVYKPGAAYCVRSLLTQESGSAAAQHCCYDRKRKLVTRGSGAGTPNFVSPEISAILHERIDVLPWRLCKGDFSRYNRVRPPNNDNGCEANPDDEEYQRQIDDKKYY